MKDCLLCEGKGVVVTYSDIDSVFRATCLLCRGSGKIEKYIFDLLIKGVFKTIVKGPKPNNASSDKIFP